jgi:hypothetical protein
MNRELDAERIGEQLGIDGVGGVVSKVEAYCTYEEQRIELTNQPRVVALRLEGEFLLEEERDLIERLSHAPPEGACRSRQKAVYYCAITAVLTLAAFVFSVLTFDPFRVGWKGYLYCAGIAIVTPFLLEQTLEKWRAERLFRILAMIGCTAAFTSLVLLAVIRGDMFVEEMTSAAPVIVIDGAQQMPQSQAQNNFYDEADVLLRLVMAFLAVAMELGAGLALHEAWRMGSDSSEDRGESRGRLGEVRQRMVAITYEITMLQNEAPVFAARFWRNFYRAMITDTVRSAMTKLLVVVAAILFVTQAQAAAQGQTTLVIAVDLTRSVAVSAPDRKTEFQKNLEAVTKLLAQVPAASRITVIGITDQSFAQPDILLSATIPADPGFFGERLSAARSELVRSWTVRSANLEPRYRSTDIVGALLLAGQIFDQYADTSKKILVIFSDMRQGTPGLDLESPMRVQSPSHSRTKENPIVADLHAAQVFALGVDGVGKPIIYWQSLRDFWAEYFRSAEADLKEYSVVRDLLGIKQAMVTPDHFD